MEAVEASAQHRFTVSTLLGLSSAIVGFGIGAQKIADNSFLTHLATGRRMLNEGIIREDTFTWTSNGEPLVVQSWLASLLYGLVDEIGGFGGLRLLMATTAGVLGWLVWQLTERSASVTTRVIVIVPVLVIGLRTWNERPLLLAFVFLAVAMLVSERRSSPRWLALIGFLWINVHGSWPLGIVLLAARWFGARLDRDDRSDHDVRAAVWLGGGMLVGGIANPYGPALLWFPVELLSRRDTLRHVSEWQASGFESMWTQSFLVLIAASFFVSRRAPLRLVVPGGLFVVAALLSARNIPVAVFVLIPLLAEGLPKLAGPADDHHSPAIRLATVVLGAMAAVLVSLTLVGPHTDVERYPVAAVDAMEELDLSPAEHRVVHQDFVGNFLDLRFGPAGAAWIDDRFELHDAELVDDYLSLLHGRPEWRDVIERHNPAAVVWERDRVLVELLTTDGWSAVWHDDDWVVLIPA